MIQAAAGADPRGRDWGGRWGEKSSCSTNSCWIWFQHTASFWRRKTADLPLLLFWTCLKSERRYKWKASLVSGVPLTILSHVLLERSQAGHISTPEICPPTPAFNTKERKLRVLSSRRVCLDDYFLSLYNDWLRYWIILSNLSCWVSGWFLTWCWCCFAETAFACGGVCATPGAALSKVGWGRLK